MREKTSKNILSILLFAVMVLVFTFTFTLTVNAEEESIDYEQEERLNALELRLQELGYKINDAENAIEAIQAAEAEESQKQLELNQKVDLLVIALNDLVNYNIEDLNNKDADRIADAEYQELIKTYNEQTLEMMTVLHEAVLEQADNTVSGNNLISKLDENITSGNEESKAMTEEYAIYILIFVGIVIGAVIGSIFAGYFKHE